MEEREEEKQLNIARFFVFVHNSSKDPHHKIPFNSLKAFFEEEQKRFYSGECDTLLQNITLRLGLLKTLDDFLTVLCAIITFYDLNITDIKPENIEKYKAGVFSAYTSSTIYMKPYHRLLVREMVASCLPVLREFDTYSETEYNTHVKRLIDSVGATAISGAFNYNKINLSPLAERAEYTKQKLVTFYGIYFKEYLKKSLFNENEPEVFMIDDNDIASVDVLDAKYEPLAYSRMHIFFKDQDRYFKWGKYAGAWAFAIFFDRENDIPYKSDKHFAIMKEQILTKIDPNWPLNVKDVNNEIKNVITIAEIVLSSLEIGTESAQCGAELIKILQSLIVYKDSRPEKPSRPRREDSDITILSDAEPLEQGSPLKRTRKEETTKIKSTPSPRMLFEKAPSEQGSPFKRTKKQEVIKIESTPSPKIVLKKDSLEHIKYLYSQNKNLIDRLFMSGFDNIDEYTLWGAYVSTVIYIQGFVDPKFVPYDAFYNDIRTLILESWILQRYILYDIVKVQYDAGRVALIKQGAIVKPYVKPYIDLYYKLGFLKEPRPDEKESVDIIYPGLTIEELFSKHTDAIKTTLIEYFGFNKEARRWGRTADKMDYIQWGRYAAAMAIEEETTLFKIAERKLDESIYIQLRNHIQNDWRNNDEALNARIDIIINRIEQADGAFPKYKRALLHTLARAKYHIETNYPAQEPVFSPLPDTTP